MSKLIAFEVSPWGPRYVAAIAPDDDGEPVVEWTRYRHEAQRWPDEDRYEREIVACGWQVGRVEEYAAEVKI
jgi:hypothetical protein